MKPVSLVMLAYNEADVIEGVIKDYHEEVISKIPGSEFVIAEDGSTDGTKNILEKLKEEYPIRIVSGDKRKGYTKAMLDGLQLAKNDIIFFSDSDGQHDPADFWLLYPHTKNYDIVSGKKSHRRDGLFRVFISHAMNTMLSLLFSIKLKDANSGFKLMKKQVVDELKNEKFSMKLASVEFMIRAINHGFKIKEVEVNHFERKYGISRGLPTKKIPKIILQTFYSLARLRSETNKKKI